MQHLSEEIRFRCEPDLKKRLKKVIQRKFKGRSVKWQTELRNHVHTWVQQEEDKTI